MQRTSRRASTTAAAFAAALALASCGGGDDTSGRDAAVPNVDPDALVAQSTRPNAKARSGRVDAHATVTLEGIRGYEETTASFSGPFSYRKGSALPDYDLEVGVRDYGLDLLSVGGKSYLRVSDTAYEVPPDIRRRLVRTSSRGRNGLTRVLEQFGVAPSRWETERRAQSIERLDGAQVVHIKTSFNAGRILRDFNTLFGLLTAIGVTQATGLPPQIPHGARRIVVRGVTSKTANTWIGAKDKVPRRSGFQMTFKIARADRARLGGITGGTLTAEMFITEVGKPQEIDAPKTVQPFSQLKLALDALAEAQG